MTGSDAARAAWTGERARAGGTSAEHARKEGGVGAEERGEQVSTASHLVLIPTDWPRRPGMPAHCSASVSLRRSEFGAASEDRLLAGFAALLFRYTGQERIGVDRETSQLRFTVDGASTLASLSAEPGPLPEGGSELRLTVWLNRVELRYDPELFERATAERMLGHLRTLVQDANRTPDRPVAALRLLSDAEAHRMLVRWNRTDSALPHDLCLHQAFEARVDLAPDAVAVVHGGRRWTYAEIDTEANRLAHHLRSLGVGPDVRVGLCLDRSAGLLISVLGIMKAGGAYVPLDPDYPTERLATMVAGTSCAVMISRAALTANLPASDTPVVLVDRDDLSGMPAHQPEALAGPDNLCYIIHTSGSTGAPKPIALRHRGVMNNVADLNSRFGVGPGDSVLALSSPSFDMSVYEFLGLTTAGGTVVIPDPDRTRDPAHWAELLRTERITVWNTAPALLGLLVDYLEQSGAPHPPALRLALLGGDWVPVPLPDRVRAFAPELRFIVMGGATEASIHSTIYEVTSTNPLWTSIPYGRPMANQRTYILDESRQPVPPGVAGELYLAGVGLARGYLDQPERTAERFTEWSYGPVTGERLYRTGDLARFGPDGLIELLGRMDFQVKINGLRVELGEIEAVLRAHPAVRQAAVVARNGRLVAYLVGGSLVPEELRDHIARRLPEFMVPTAFVPLDELPLTPNGKLDRKGLPEPELTGPGYRAPVTTAERALADVYAEVLDSPRIGLDDDFLALGGDSIRAIQVVTRARARGIDVTARQILQLRTIAAIGPGFGSLSAEEDVVDLGVVSPTELTALTRRYPGLADVWPLTPMQSGMLFESQLDESEVDTYQLQTVYHLSGPVDPDRMRTAGEALLARHPSLRAAFVTDATDSPVSVVLDGVVPEWRVLDLTGVAEPAQEHAFEVFLGEDRAARFDLTTPPLVRLTLVRLAPDRARLVLTVHHALIDGWTEQNLAADLMHLYAGDPIAPARSYRDFLTWLAHRDHEAAAVAWKTTLDGVPAPVTLLPQGTPRPGAGSIREFTLPLPPGDLVPAPELGVTANTVAQAAWAVLLGALAGRDDVVFGATVAGRPGELAGVESMAGLFINTIPVRASPGPQGTVGGLLGGLRDTQAALLDHQHHSLTEIHQSLGVDALFDTLMVFQSFPAARPSGAGVQVTRIDSLGTGSYPLTLIVEPDRLTVQYDHTHFPLPTIEDLATRFHSVATQLATAGPSFPLGRLADLPEPLHPGGATVGTTPEPTAGYAAPRTPREESLCTLIADVLGVDRIGIHDNFFTLGCNSLKATRIIGRMRRTLGLDATIKMIFQHATIAELSDQVTATTTRPTLRKMSG